MPYDRNSEAQSLPEDYDFLNELAASLLVADQQDEELDDGDLQKSRDDNNFNNERKREFCQGHESLSSSDDDIPDDFINLNELASPSPTHNPNERHHYQQEFLEERRSQRQIHSENVVKGTDNNQFMPDGTGHQPIVEGLGRKTENLRRSRASKIATEFYTVSYLISFSIFGCLARLGLQALTAYPGSPVTTSVLWANVGGCIVMGFLSEDRKLFKAHRTMRNKTREEVKRDDPDMSENTLGTTNQVNAPNHEDPENGVAECQQASNASKKTISLYIGLTTGFCGSFTSFSSFIRDVFLEVANQPPAVHSGTTSTSALPRNGGYSFMAAMAVIIFTVSLCISALKFGAHLAIGLENVIPSLPSFLTSKTFDQFAALCSWCLWLASIMLVIWPPDRPRKSPTNSSMSRSHEAWRGEVLLSLVFAPVGCVLRFYASLRMNGTIASFPLGTFVVNISGTAILGMCWSLQHAPLGTAGGGIGGGRVGCQVLQGVDDGFCGCLTTISTWVLELTSLRRKHAYTYGSTSICIGLAFLVVIMGSLIWSRGVSPLTCSS